MGEQRGTSVRWQVRRFIVACQLEQRYDDREMLRHVAWSARTSGARRWASRLRRKRIFSKPSGALNSEESARLAALVRAPGLRGQPERWTERARLIQKRVAAMRAMTVLASRRGDARMTEATAGVAQGKPAAKIDRGAWSWALFEWARNPWVLLGTIYVFTPYVSNVVIGDPVRGQSIIAGWHATAGAHHRVHGAVPGRCDRSHGPAQAVAGVGDSGAGVRRSSRSGWRCRAMRGCRSGRSALAVIVSGVSFVYTEVVHNAMLTRAAPPGTLSHVSGLGLRSAASRRCCCLVFVLVTMALPGQIDCRSCRMRRCSGSIRRSMSRAAS